ncbi:MAG: AAC(3) family N-acetyltransferase [Chloroflexota bacterium]
MQMTNEVVPQTITQRDIESGLQQLGLGRSDAVEVHSSLSSFGHVDRGAATLVNGLMNVVGEEGALVMSAYPLSPAVPLTLEEEARGMTWKVRKLDPDSTEKTGLGAVVDEFRQRPDVHFGSGIHRVCAWGRNAHFHTQGYTYLLEIDGWALLLGETIHSCSSMHVAERVGLPEEVQKIHRVPDDILADYPEDEWDIGFGTTPNDAWMTVWEEAERRKLIRHQTIGQAECKLFKANALVTIFEDFLRTDPYRLYGVERDQKG